MFKTVLIGVDGKHGGRDAMALARQLADPDARFLLAHVYGAEPLTGHGSSSVFGLDQIDGEKLLAREQHAFAAEADLIVTGGRSVAGTLREIAERRQADLIVLGSSRHALVGHVRVHDDTRAALNGGRCAVAVAPRGYADAVKPLRQIGVGYDDSRQSRYALSAGRELAARHDAHLDAMWVVSGRTVREDEPIPADWPRAIGRLLDDRRRRLEALGVRARAVYGGAPEELARFAARLDLLVVGSRGYGLAGRLMHGSTASYLVGHSACALLVLPRHVHTQLEEEMERPVPTAAAPPATNRWRDFAAQVE